jgi:hypothetical protein
MTMNHSTPRGFQTCYEVGGDKSIGEFRVLSDRPRSGSKESRSHAAALFNAKGLIVKKVQAVRRHGHTWLRVSYNVRRKARETKTGTEAQLRRLGNRRGVMVTPVKSRPGVFLISTMVAVYYFQVRS